MNIIQFFANKALNNKVQLSKDSGDTFNVSQYEPTVIQITLNPTDYPDDNYTLIFYLSSPAEDLPSVYDDKKQYKYKMHLRSVGDHKYEVVLNDYLDTNLVIGDDNRISQYYFEIITGYDVDNPDCLMGDSNTMQWCTSVSEDYNTDDIRALFKYI